jgi:8-amino-7-oxononanoate synthase
VADRAGSVLDRLREELKRLESGRQLRRLEQVQGIDLSSNDYLGLASDPRLKRAVIRALEQGERAGSTGSRLLSGNAERWENLESEFAQYVGSEASLFFSSGYAANTGLLSAVLGPDDIVYSDNANHASIIDGIRLSKARKVIFPHLDLNFLEDRLRASPPGGHRFIVVESVFSMEGDRAPLREIAGLSERHGAELIVDEAHATGVFGPEGRGAIAEEARPPCVLASVHTCGKAFGSAGAFVACSEVLKQFLVNRARSFIFSTALPPYLAAQVSASINIVREADDLRARLHSLAAALQAQLRAQGWNTGNSASQIVPVILGSNELALATAARLQRACFAVRAIRPPSVPEGTSRLRLSLNARLSFEDLQRLTQALGTVTSDR